MNQHFSIWMGQMGLDFWSFPQKAEDFFSFPAVKKAATAHKVTGAQARVEREVACFFLRLFLSLCGPKGFGWSFISFVVSLWEVKSVF